MCVYDSQFLYSIHLTLSRGVTHQLVVEDSNMPNNYPSSKDFLVILKRCRQCFLINDHEQIIVDKVPVTKGLTFYESVLRPHYVKHSQNCDEVYIVY